MMAPPARCVPPPPREAMRSIYAVTEDALIAWLASEGQPAYRARQILEGVYGHRAAAFADLSSVPRGLRARLAEEFQVGPLPVLSRLDGRDSTKLLLRLADGTAVECVAMKARWGATACVSSQVGCPMACAFCASGGGGLERDLSADEILRQVISLAATGTAITNVVFMGMGEPLLNYDNVLAAVAAITAPDRLGIAPRHLTIGTAGVAPMIPRLAEDAPPRLELAVSLNAPTDELRRELMPAAARWPIAELLAACNAWTEVRGGQPVTYAYVLIAGVNDTPPCADRLVRLLRHRRHLVNLIRMNPVEGCALEPSSKSRAEGFAAGLASAGLNVTLRRSLGRDVSAACGQLRRQDQARREAPRARSRPAPPVQRPHTSAAPRRP
jgi:23S rRNA (adenine2503-C2)-methyltransferase